jgi:cell division topological specificity factor MinE
MFDIFHWLLSRGEYFRRDYFPAENSKNTARQRLQQALTQDRVELAPEFMDDLKHEMLAVFSRYMVVGEDFLEFEIRRLDESVVLVSNILVKELNRLAPAH